MNRQIELLIERAEKGEKLFVDALSIIRRGRDIEESLNVANAYYRKGLYDKADDWYRFVVEAGKPNSQCFRIGKYYENGQGVQQDYSEALKWYRIAANNGNIEAKIKVGIFYRDGLGSEQNYSEAKKWFERASNFKLLGEIYMAEQDWEKAISYLKQIQFDVFAQYNIGVCYDKLGNIQDASKWYSKAADSGLLCAHNALKRLSGSKK